MASVAAESLAALAQQAMTLGMCWMIRVLDHQPLILLLLCGTYKRVQSVHYGVVTKKHTSAETISLTLDLGQIEWVQDR